MAAQVIDAWMQHPTRGFLASPIFDSLRRWSHDTLPAGDVPPEETIAAMDRVGVRVGLLSAWWGRLGR